jgi:hypothetical protein
VFQSEAQNTFSFPDTTAYWNMFSFNWGNMYVENPIGVVGDTTINNTQYLKICQSTDTLFEFQADYPFYCAVREEDSKYYFVFPNETSEILYYGLEENQILPLKVFPNPATEQISFEVLSDELVNSQFEIVNIKGEIFYSSIIDYPSFSVSINNLSPGVYFYDITHSSERVYRGKFVKQ